MSVGSIANGILVQLARHDARMEFEPTLALTRSGPELRGETKTESLKIGGQFLVSGRGPNLVEAPRIQMFG